MSVFSDFVRSVTGGRGVGETAGRAVGGFFGGPAGAEAGGKFGREASKSLDEFAGDRDVSTAPSGAGVDSPATLQNVSQTGQLAPRQIQIDPRFRSRNMQSPNQAFLGPLVTQFGRGLVTGPGRNVALGVGGGLVADALGLFDGSGQKLIITRKMQREVKEIFMFMGGDLQATADAYSNFKMRSYTADNILAIMLKKFSSQGPFVTKAAVRKTRQTLRKMKTLADMTSDLMPRKAPVRRRASTTTTKLVRNG